MRHTGIEIITDEPDEVRRATQMIIREGAATIKINISGNNFVRPHFSEALAYTDAEGAAAAIGMPGELGLVKEGYLANLVMINGVPLKDQKLFRNRDTLLMVMKDDSYYKPPQPRRAEAARIAAELQSRVRRRLQARRRRRRQPRRRSLGEPASPSFRRRAGSR
jgi:hypothetical protein